MLDVLTFSHAYKKRHFYSSFGLDKQRIYLQALKYNLINVCKWQRCQTKRKVNKIIKSHILSNENGKAKERRKKKCRKCRVYRRIAFFIFSFYLSETKNANCAQFEKKC